MDTWWPLANLALAPLFFVVALPLVHLSHASACRLLGLDVHTISIGRGRPLLRGRLFGAEVVLYRNPLFGSVTVSCRDKRRVVLRYWLAVFAVPLTLFIVLLCLAALDDEFHLWPTDSTDFDPRGVAHGVVLFVAAFFAVGYYVELVSIPFRRRQLADALIGSNYLARGTKAIEEERHGDALRELEAGLAAVPGYWPLEVTIAALQLTLKDYDLSRVGFLALLERKDVPPKTRAAAQNNLAWMDLLAGERMVEADELSRAALEACPREGSIQSTRGCVLIELGKITEGLVHVRISHELAELDHKTEAQALTAIWIAIAEARQGHEAEARKYLELARGFNSNVDFQDRAEAALAQAKLSTAEPGSD